MTKYYCTCGKVVRRARCAFLSHQRKHQVLRDTHHEISAAEYQRRLDAIVGAMEGADRRGPKITPDHPAYLDGDYTPEGRVRVEEAQ